MQSIILSEISEQWKQRLKTAGKVAGGAAALGAAGYGAYAADDKFNDGAATKAITNAAKSASNWTSDKTLKLRHFLTKKDDPITQMDNLDTQRTNSLIAKNNKPYTDMSNYQSPKVNPDNFQKPSLKISGSQRVNDNYPPINKPSGTNSNALSKFEQDAKNIRDRLETEKQLNNNQRILNTIKNVDSRNLPTKDNNDESLMGNLFRKGKPKPRENRG